MESETELEAELQALEQKWDAIAETRPTPRSTMNVIEYGLGKQRRAEVYINRLLRYLLDPDEPHQMETDFLEAFLEALPDECDFSEDTYDLSTIRVDEQNSIEDATDESSSRGYIDLLIEAPNEWFLLVELKFSAEETGTTFYCDSTHIDGRPKTSYESGQYYLYLHQANRPAASGDCFSNWTWQSFVEDLLDGFIAEHAARYPQRTVTQLHDLRDDLTEISGMSDQHDIDQRKVELYLDHFAAISDVSETFDDAWDDYRTHWGEALATRFDGRGGSFEGREDTVVLQFPRDDGETERWILRNRDADWQHIFRDGWWIREESHEPLEQRADDYNDYRIGFYHRMGDDYRPRRIRNREVMFNFRCMGSNPTAFRDIYNDLFADREAEITELLAGTEGELTGQKRTLIESTYEIKVDAHDGFFEAYTAALESAFVDFVVDNEPLVELLEETFDDAVEQYE